MEEIQASYISQKYIIKTVLNNDQQPKLLHRITGEERPFDYEEMLDLIKNSEENEKFSFEYKREIDREGKARKLSSKEDFKMHEVIWRKIGDPDWK